MENLYFYIVLLLTVLAIGDLIVGVSNDAVNFLNSAIGSKAISFRNIMILASIGIALGAIFSSGMMEVARKGIFNPSAFSFQEIIYIFMAVMITDILHQHHKSYTNYFWYFTFSGGCIQCGSCRAMGLTLFIDVLYRGDFSIKKSAFWRDFFSCPLQFYFD